ncbi:hypothetical protein B0J14DRAFT_100114 [Halenospora varia]|nr:hypothetical protein B0J14DRAFT_100114 [Halenospora varia]
MELPKEWSSPLETRWKITTIFLTFAHAMLDVYMSRRQLNLLKRDLSPSDVVIKRRNARITEGNPHNGFVKPTYQFTAGTLRECLVILIVIFDIIPQLWSLVAKIQVKHFEIPIEDDLPASYMFVCCCYTLWKLIQIPDVLYRHFILRENGIRSWFITPARDSIFHKIARGQSMTSLIFFITFGVLLFKMLDKKINQNFVVFAGVFQVFFVIFYPIFSQPGFKSMKVMEDGEFRSKLEDLAAVAGFSMKEIYVLNARHDAIYADVQMNGWPRKTYLTVRQDALEKYTTTDIVALFAQELGSWKYYNNLGVFCIGQQFFNYSICSIILFMEEKSIYQAFGFKGQQPLVAGIALYAIIIAPPLSAIFRLLINQTAHRTQFLVDKRAMELGYLFDLGIALCKANIPLAEAGERDWLYSMYYYPKPSVSQRLGALEKLEMDAEVAEKAEGAIKL